MADLSDERKLLYSVMTHFRCEHITITTLCQHQAVCGNISELKSCGKHILIKYHRFHICESLGTLCSFKSCLFF